MRVVLCIFFSAVVTGESILLSWSIEYLFKIIDSIPLLVWSQVKPVYLPVDVTPAVIQAIEMDDPTSLARIIGIGKPKSRIYVKVHCCNE